MSSCKREICGVGDCLSHNTRMGCDGLQRANLLLQPTDVGRRNSLHFHGGARGSRWIVSKSITNPIVSFISAGDTFLERRNQPKNRIFPNADQRRPFGCIDFNQQSNAAEMIRDWPGRCGQRTSRPHYMQYKSGKWCPRRDSNSHTR